jgi:hypothetical protein
MEHKKVHPQEQVCPSSIVASEGGTVEMVWLDWPNEWFGPDGSLIYEDTSDGRTGPEVALVKAEDGSGLPRLDTEQSWLAQFNERQGPAEPVREKAGTMPTQKKGKISDYLEIQFKGHNSTNHGE